MLEIPATEFAKHFGRYRELAQRESLVITSHGRPSGYFVSEREYAEYQRLKSASRRAYHISELPEETIQALASVKMSSEHDYLNKLLDD